MSYIEFAEALISRKYAEGRHQRLLTRASIQWKYGWIICLGQIISESLRFLLNIGTVVYIIHVFWDWPWHLMRVMDDGVYFSYEYIRVFKLTRNWFVAEIVSIIMWVRDDLLAFCGQYEECVHISWQVVVYEKESSPEIAPILRLDRIFYGCRHLLRSYSYVYA